MPVGPTEVYMLANIPSIKNNKRFLNSSERNLKGTSKITAR
jgi:hypothetical protein